MTALSEFRNRANQDFPGVEITADDGTELTLRSPVNLSEDEQEEYDRLSSALEENDEVSDIKQATLGLLGVLAGDPDAVRRALAGESLGTLMSLFKELNRTTEDAAKSAESASGNRAARRSSKR